MEILGIIFFEGFQFSAPIALAALGGIFSEKCGVINIGLEGTMLVSAFLLTWGALLTHSIWGGLILAIVGGAMVALLHAAVTITFKVDQIVSGVVINILSLSLTRYFSQVAFGSSAQSSSNSFLFPTFMGVSSFIFILIPLTVVCLFVLYRTPFGLRLSIVGENPMMAQSMGVDVRKLRYIGVVLSGVFCGIASATLYPEQWIVGMVGGRGFLALAAVIFGRWNPVGAVLAAMLFGYSEALSIILESRIPISGQLIKMAPYILAVAVLAGAVGRVKPPAAAGVPFVEEDEE